MPSRRQIRESAFQILVYEGGSPDSQPNAGNRHRFWDSTDELDRLWIHYRTRSILRHHLFLRVPLVSQLRELEPSSEKILRPGEIGKILKFSADSLVASEKEWEIASTNLALVAPTDDEAGKLRKYEESHEALCELSRLDDLLDAQRKSFLELVDAQPQFLVLLKGLTAAVADLQFLADKARGLAETSTPFPAYSASLLSVLRAREASPPPTYDYFIANSRLTGHRERVETLVHRIQELAPILVPSSLIDRLSDSFGQLGEREIRLNHLIESLNGTSTADDLSDAVEFLQERIARVFDFDADLILLRRRFLNDLEDYPAHNILLGPFARLVRRLQAVSERMQLIRKPDEMPALQDLKKLKAKKVALTKLRSESDALADAVLREKDDIDKRLAAVVENFAPERIDPVDRAILRLATWEILHAEKVPAPVAIDEAIELAKRFGTTDSGRFVNGVLDKIAKQAASADG